MLLKQKVYIIIINSVNVSFNIKGTVHPNNKQGVCLGVQKLNMFPQCEHNQHIQFTFLQLIMAPAQVILTKMCS